LEKEFIITEDDVETARAKNSEEPKTIMLQASRKRIVEENKTYSTIYSSGKKQKLPKTLSAQIIELEDNNKSRLDKLFGRDYSTSVRSSVNIISIVEDSNQIIKKIQRIRIYLNYY
jgi:hypothetical protein